MENPLEAITSGAVLLVDVSMMLDASEDESRVSLMRKASSEFHSDSIWATLHFSDGEDLTIFYRGGVSVAAENRVYLLLGDGKNMPTGKEFSKVDICAKNTIDEVDVYWRNYTM